MGITVLSLFDGISCGMVALERAGIEVDKYIAYEIEHNAIEISKKNYPEIVRGGDVTKEDFTKYKGKIDILIGGSPCQNLCSCGNRKGLEGEESRLFFDYVRALYETEAKWFLLEKEKKEYECYKRMMAKEEGTLAHKKAWSQVKTLDQKSRALTTAQNISNSGATNIKYSDTEYYILTPLECERLQTLPDNYTEGVSNTQRYKAIGNGWTVDVIAHIFKYLKKAIEENIEPVKLKDHERPQQSYRRMVNTEEKKTEEKTINANEVIEMQEKEKYEKKIAELERELKEKDKEISKIRGEMQTLKDRVFNILLEKACG